MRIIGEALIKLGERFSGRGTIQDKIKMILDNEINALDQPFEMIVDPGKHVGKDVFPYDLGDGVCTRLHYSERAHTSGTTDYMNHIMLASEGFPVPKVKSELVKGGGKAVFAVELIDGDENWRGGDRDVRRSSY